MKHSLQLFLMITVTSIMAQTADVPTSVRLAPPVQPPAIVGERFSAAYPNTRPEWSLDGDVFTARLSAGQASVQAVRFSREGRLLGTEGLVEHRRYPKNIRRFLESDPEGPSRGLWVMTDSAGAVTYFSPYGGDTLWFDAAGRYSLRPGRAKAPGDEEDIHSLRTIASLQIMEASMASLAMVNGTDRSKSMAAARMDCLRERHAALESLAAEKKVRLPGELLPRQKKEYERLAALQGRAFDRAYAKLSCKTRKRLDAAARRALRSDDGAVRTSAAKDLSACP